MKDDSVYLFNDATYIFQDKPLEIIMDDDDNMDENFEKYLPLATELLKETKILKWGNNYLKNEELIKIYQGKEMLIMSSKE